MKSPKETRRWRKGSGRKGSRRGRRRARHCARDPCSRTSRARTRRPDVLARRGSGHCCVTSTSLRSNGRSGGSDVRPVQASTGRRWRTTSGIWRPISSVCTKGSTADSTGPSRCAEPSGQAGAVRPVAPRGQDPADRVRAVCRLQQRGRRAATPGDLRLSGLSRTTAARPEGTSSWSSGRRKPSAWSES